MQSEELKDMVAVHLVPIHEDLGEIKLRAELQDNRIAAIEERVDRFERSGGGIDDVERIKFMNENDPAFKQIAFSGFKLSDMKKRVQILKDFALTHFADQNIANIETIMNGPWKGRKPTSTVVMEFFSRDARDVALTAAKNQKVFDSGSDLGLKIDRARTKAQRARNWALRKAEELAKVEAQKRGVVGAARIDFTMPVRRVFVGDELAFAQKKDELRGIFVDVFAACVLPP